MAEPERKKKKLRHRSTFGTLEREHSFAHPNTKSSDYPEVHRLVEPLISSFNALFTTIKPGESDVSPVCNDGLLALIVRELDPVAVFDGKAKKDMPLGNKLEFKLENLLVGRPQVHDSAQVKDKRIFPSEARERMITYDSRMDIDICWRLNGGSWHKETCSLGNMPIMVRTSRCNLRRLPAADLVKRHEESEEWGGYFIINGNERLIRYLIVPRRNHVTALIRSAFANRGPAYSPYGVSIKCIRADQSAKTNLLHWLTTGGVTMRFTWLRNEYLLPVVMLLKALTGATDKAIFADIAQNDIENSLVAGRVEQMLVHFRPFRLFTAEQCLDFIGEKFHVVLRCPEDWTYRQVGRWLINKVILIHLDDWRDKYRLLCFMIRKLYALVDKECCEDNPDSPQHQEILLPGHLYANIMREKLEDILQTIRGTLMAEAKRSVGSVDFTNNKNIKKTVQRSGLHVGQKLRYFLATGNLVTSTGLDLQQGTGFTIVGEKLNYYRYLSHFRSVHRGAFFAEMKTTTVRKLLPEAWGFLCPVHTPDGSPCGLLNHFAHQCRLITSECDVSTIATELASLGMIPSGFEGAISGEEHLSVQLDGKVIGFAPLSLVRFMAESLRRWKTRGQRGIPLSLEIGYVPQSKAGQYPGLYLFSTPGRMSRPVRIFDRIDDDGRLVNPREDRVGPFEQVYLNIACKHEEIESGVHTHVEYAPTHMLSVLANLTPFSDYNQSPRNMYQCQMGKQTMGTPATALPYRADNKLYRLQTGQTPIVRPKLHHDYGFDQYPNGTNAIVAVISYTGYDMEDAMILNKSAFERGFGHGQIYKSHIVNIKPKGEILNHWFELGKDIPKRHKYRDFLDSDGLPHIGVRISQGDPLAAWWDNVEKCTKLDKYKGDETCYVEEVRLMGTDKGDEYLTRIHIKLRIMRAPEIGDKFSSRHGQKGVCSQKYPDINMPFSESGMRPDVIINPHAFPSRMTIGMLIESLGGKAGALHGLAQDATPFTYSEKYTPYDHFGEQLIAAGYNYHGNEPMYSGVTGREFMADIYLGVVYYQRLRHMVGDKWQVRTVGPVDQRTRQPIKGRKRGGGIRFGEMERDALLAHGTSFLLQDRLMNCSDYSTAWVCRTCGSIITLGYDPVSIKTSVGLDNEATHDDAGPGGEYCRVCRAKDAEEAAKRPASSAQFKLGGDRDAIARRQRMTVIPIPFVFRFLCAELAAMGIKLSLSLTTGDVM